MTNRKWLFSSESVTPGHPDRTTDIIVENIMSEILKQDPESKIALEALLGKGFITIAGELTTEAYVNIEQIVRNTITEVVGFDRAKYGLDGHSTAVLVALSEQSKEIAGGVFNSLENRNQVIEDDYDLQGAGDQGIVFGIATAHNTSYHPVSHKIACLLAEKLYDVRTSTVEGAKILLPDGKTQVTISFDGDVPVEVNTVLISTQHKAEIPLAEVQRFVIENVIKPVIKDYNQNHALGGFSLKDAGNYIVNPAGSWSIGSSASDVGLVNRKIVGDTSGGFGRHGGGGLNGKDFSKTDRSGVYAARHAAKNLVAAGVADQLEIQIGYAIGQAKPVSVNVNTFGTERVSLDIIDEIVEEFFDFRPLAIKAKLVPSPDAYKFTALFGHLGRNPDDLFPWERLDVVESIKEFLRSR